MKIAIPEFAHVVLIGTSGSGKSTFARKHFLPTEVLSSDAFRGWVSDDENRLDISGHAFEALHFLLAKRLELGRLTVVDATNVQREARAPLLKLASEWHALKVAIILDTPMNLCTERNASRPDRQFGSHVVRAQRNDLRRTLGQLKSEKWHKVYVLTPDEIDSVEIVREAIWSRRPNEHGPFDIVGDVHGCLGELHDLLKALGWLEVPEWHHPAGRKLVFLGDLVDRGPDSVGVLKLVMSLHERDQAICVPGNHDVKLSRYLQGQKVQLNHGLAETVQQLDAETQEFRASAATWIHGLVSHAVLDDGKLCVAHAGLRESMQGRGSSAVRDFALFGETTGEIDEFGLPVRYEWARNYRGRALVVYGHTPVPTPEWINNTIDIDTGCCFGGALTALRYPERELVSVPARQVYVTPARPIGLRGERGHPDADVLDLEDVIGRRSVETRLAGRVTIREENAIAALEVMSRFAADPRWLIYLPPTMSPCQTSERDGFLEHPTEAISYFTRDVDVSKVVCEEKHMGSRAVAVLCRSREAAERRFRVGGDEVGIVFTRTGRPFFEDPCHHATILDRMIAAADRAGLFEELETDWLLVDLEVMPWSAKALGLLRSQYAPVGAAANASAQAWHRVAEGMMARHHPDAAEWTERAAARTHSADSFRELTGATAGTSTASRGTNSLRFTCSPPRGASTSIATTCGTWKR